MKQKTLSRWLIVIIAITAVCIATVYALVPQWITYFTKEVKDSDAGIWTVVIYITAVPVFIALYQGVRIAMNIGHDESFTKNTARRLGSVSYLAVADGLFFFIASLIFRFAASGTNFAVAVGIVVFVICVFVAVIFAALSHWIYKAAELKEEADLTI